ncbi:MAG: SDR family oxidoreductase [Bacteroidia bacterium]|nr:SDR family oxidoreductase [Bacteroidia bacterium]
MNLKDKVIIVTGGNGLIGSEIIKKLKYYEAIVINVDVNIDSNLENGLFYCDITDEKSIYNLFDEVLKKFGKLDGIVNNAYPRTEDWGAKFENVKIESWRRNVDMQMNSIFVICQKALEIMKNQQFGSIVNIASIYGVVGNDFTVYDNTNNMTSPAAYAAIKGGVINFSRYLASYYGKNNVRINCVSPGGIFNHQNEVFVSNFETKVPMKRMGRPDDISGPVAFMLSEESKYITGQNIIVDGGWTAI